MVLAEDCITLQTAAAGIDHSGHCQLAVIIMMVLPAGQALRKRLTYRERNTFIIFCVIAARHTRFMSVHLNRVSPHPTGCWIGIWTGRTGRGFHSMAFHWNETQKHARKLLHQWFIVLFKVINKLLYLSTFVCIFNTNMYQISVCMIK